MAAFGDLECALNDVLLALSTFGFSRSLRKEQKEATGQLVFWKIFVGCISNWLWKEPDLPGACAGVENYHEENFACCCRPLKSIVQDQISTSSLRQFVLPLFVSSTPRRTLTLTFPFGFDSSTQLWLAILLLGDFKWKSLIFRADLNSHKWPPKPDIKDGRIREVALYLFDKLNVTLADTN